MDVSQATNIYDAARTNKSPKFSFFMFPEILKTPRLTTKTDFIYVFAYFWFFNLKTSKSPVAHLQLIKPLIKNVNIFCKKLSINDSPHGVITTE